MMLRTLTLFAAAALTIGASDPASRQLLDDVRILSADDMQGRLTDTAGSAKARAYLVRRLAAIGVIPVGKSFEQPFTGKLRNGTAYTGTNLVGVIKGTGKSDGAKSDRVIVIGAHYDHLGVREGQVHNGADDNASGVAAALEIAAAMMRERPRHDVIIALWDAEERGLTGARAFVATPPVPLARVVINLNLDMIGRGDKGELWLSGAGRHAALKPWFERLAKEAPVTLKLGHDTDEWKGSDDWTYGSDHGAFHAAGIPFAYFGVEDHPDYHKPTDDFDKIPQAFFIKAAQTTLQAARLFDAELDAIAKATGRDK